MSKNLVYMFIVLEFYQLQRLRALKGNFQIMLSHLDVSGL